MFVTPVADVAALVALALVLIAIAIGLAVIWRRRTRRYAERMEALEQRLRVLEDARRAPPKVRLAFEYDQRDQVVRLHVTNPGARDVFHASVIVHGALATALDRPVFARWAHTDRPNARLEPGQSAALCVARLELSFPLARWHLQLTDAAATALDVPAAHTSVIGGPPVPEAHPILLEVTVSAGQAEAVPAPCVIALHPFDAEWVLGRPDRRALAPSVPR